VVQQRENQQGSKTVSIVHKWYQLQQWRGKDGLRATVLARDPFCVDCKTAQATHADHIKPFASGKNEQEQWDLFCSLSNLAGRCRACHSIKTAKFDGGFGHSRLDERTTNGGVELTAHCAGVPVKYVVSSFPDAIEKALVGKVGK
jgi:5-methylcytosine-specific restriction endonuclease McrA